MVLTYDGLNSNGSISNNLAPQRKQKCGRSPTMILIYDSLTSGGSTSNNLALLYKAGNSLPNYQLTISWTNSLSYVESPYPFRLFHFEVQIVCLKPVFMVETDN